MKTTNFLSKLSLLLIFIASTSVFANNQDPVRSDKKTEPSKTIVDVAVGNENFSTLVAAVKAADLVGTLNSEGPFTVFAPTNDAFARLPEGTVENLLKEENKSTLSAVLTYHVVAGEFKAADVLKAIKESGGMFEISTVNGEKLTAHLKDGKVMLKDAQGNMSTVIMTDVEASNGVIHAIDTVVMP
ncbi:fasciclin domain-containing protein [Lutimonas zeaxanthinifaciens]|uniref:fasciclin domain-containing protein n=1 Tax=Lutimonas zeaxanthinifaciens TaxID=3060215 RepID=UPI00265D5305|nr:fasciclin domain-containing protein [Lutimonas sp. YSD2104]WKK65648.1 fasciclin domain-containing protein [Lutimonas sp. YSD2104]